MEGHRSTLIVKLLLYFQGAGTIIPNVYCLIIAAGDNELFPDTNIKTSDLGNKIRNVGFVELTCHVVEFGHSIMLCVFCNVNVGLEQLALVSHHIDRVFC